MKQLSNKELILTLIEGCEIDDKLDILTSIGLGTKCDKLFKTTEEIRTELCDEEDAKNKESVGVRAVSKREESRILLQKASDGEDGVAELV